MYYKMIKQENHFPNLINTFNFIFNLLNKLNVENKFKQIR